MNAEEPKGQSKIFNTSVRAWLAIVFGSTICLVVLGTHATELIMAMQGKTELGAIKLDPNFVAIVTGVIGFYFGQRTTEGQK